MKHKSSILTLIFSILCGGMLLFFPALHRLPWIGWLIQPYRTFNASMFGVWLLITLSANLLVGYSGQVSTGQATIVLLGAYLTAILRQQIGLPFPLALLLAGIGVGLIGGYLIGLPAVRLSGPYLGIATFALAVAVPQLLKSKMLSGWTNGVRGFRLTPLQLPISLTAGPLSGWETSEVRYYIVLFWVVLLTLGFYNFVRSRYGRVLLALREDEVAAAHMGIAIRPYKQLAFGFSSFYAGSGGGLFFLIQGFVSPDSLGLFDSILILVAVVIGGLGSLTGSVLGALFLTFQAEAISTLTRWLPQAENLGSVFFGLLLIAATILFPNGVARYRLARGKIKN